MVEVVPTAHYFMGGVVVRRGHAHAMQGLYVAGEDAGGAHGSNRLGGNGVANSTVYGGIAGDVMAADSADERLRDPDETVLDAEIAARAPFPTAGDCQRLRERLQDCMWDDVGVMRTQTG